MDGHDLRMIMSDIGVANFGEVVFIDKEGKTHEVNGFIRTRVNGVGIHILCESYDFGFGLEYKADPWPEDLKRYLIEHDLADINDFKRKEK